MSESDSFMEKFNQMLKELREQRSKTQMTLGKLLDRLEDLPGPAIIRGFSRPHSYRGYYADIAFVPVGEQMVSELISTIQNECLRHSYPGWKGGEFRYDTNAPVWLAEVGSGGRKLVEIKFENGAYTPHSVEEKWD